MTGQLFENLQKKWFSASAPVNKKKATATLTFSGVVADAQTVTIGTEIYEFKTSGNAGTGKIKVDVSGGVTASAAVTALVTAIEANTNSLVNAADGAGDTVVVTAKAYGTSGNSITVSTTATNGSWGQDITVLSGGQYATPCKTIGTLVKDTTYYYICETAGSNLTTVWKRFTLAAY